MHKGPLLVTYRTPSQTLSVTLQPLLIVLQPLPLHLQLPLQQL